MARNAHFKVDTKLAELLGESYNSVEKAIKELVDNSYDADSSTVHLSFPEPFEDNPQIIVADNGDGMTEDEIREEYLNIANGRTSRKGEFTKKRKRKVKGKKGVGKFAGLLVAEIMEVQTSSGDTTTTLTINKSMLAKANYDLEEVPLPITSEKKPQKNQGTKIILSAINDNLNFPNAERMKEILMWDYGREKNFEIFINDNKIGVLDIQGQSYSKEIEFEGKTAYLSYTVTEKPFNRAGIILKVLNKVIGKPVNYLKTEDSVPDKLKKRIYGEIICDDLKDELTPWDDIIENGKSYNILKEKITEELKSTVGEVFKTDMKLAKARFQKKINAELAKLPQHKVPFAKKALNKALEKFYGESKEKIDTIISVMINALEQDHYWSIIQSIRETRNSDVEKFADALSEFGFLEIGIVTSQAINRLRFLDELGILINNPKTLEKDVHKALEKNTWILGDDYSVLSSDTSLKTAIDNILNKKYKGKNANKRPDLLLGRLLNRRLTLIEFKRPDFKLNRDTERQAVEYKDELGVYFGNQPIEIILLGGKIEKSIKEVANNIRYDTYLNVISIAKQRLEWLLDELNKEDK